MKTQIIFKKLGFVTEGIVSRREYVKRMLLGFIPIFSLLTIWVLMMVVLDMLGLGPSARDSYMDASAAEEFSQSLTSKVPLLVSIVISICTVVVIPWTIIYQICLSVRRLHDIQWPWWTVIMLGVPYLNWLFLVLLIAIPSKSLTKLKEA